MVLRVESDVIRSCNQKILMRFNIYFRGIVKVAYLTTRYNQLNRFVYC